jgi:tetratricopeptide (TPR) repeat protein
MANDPWDLLRVGKNDEALVQMRDTYAKDRSASAAMELGVAYLWVGAYQEARQHFDGFIQAYPRHADIIYGMAGVARWCLKDRAGAAEMWHAGLRCKFADAAGGVGLPLLLFFASVAAPEILAMDHAEKLLSERMNDPRTRNWPGALARFVLGQIDEGRLRSECLDKNESETTMRHLQADFYVAVLQRARGNAALSAETMRHVAGLPWSEYDSSKRIFLAKLWQEEFFLARHESHARPPSGD